MNTLPTTITSFEGSLEGKKVIIRAELNAPLKDGKVDDDFRIQKFLPTLKYITDKGGIAIVLAHVGRDKDETLEPVVEYMSEHVPNMVFFQNFFAAWKTADWEGNIEMLKKDLQEAGPGDLYVLDNVRQIDAEEEGDLELAEELRGLADFYVHEAFPAAHRKHMSTYTLPTLFSRDSKFSGITFHEELTSLLKVLKPESPSVFVLGGAKFETKLPLIKQMLPVYDSVVIGGALANNLFELTGHKIGLSKKEDLSEEQKAELLAALANPKFVVPEIVTCETAEGQKIDRNIKEVQDTDKILDISPMAINDLRVLFSGAKTIVWNGPLGYYEGGYTDGSKTLASLIGTSEAYSVAGGGDTINAIYDAHQETNFSYLSSAGGAMIDFLVDGDLPGVNALL